MLLTIEFVFLMHAMVCIFQFSRSFCPKSLEMMIVFTCMILGILISLYIALGMNVDEGKCEESRYAVVLIISDMNTLLFD